MYSIGLDYGTQTCRALLLNLQSGEIVKVVEAPYPNGVITERFDGKLLKANLVLQHPSDYLNVMKNLITELTNKLNINSRDIKALGIDFTSCTVLPVDELFTPLYENVKFKQHPQAYAKLWKSHSASEEARYITEVLNTHPYLEKYGGKISSEWLFPKLLELKRDAEEVYNECVYFMEAGDWLVSKLTNRLIRSSSQAGFKGIWQKKKGFLDRQTLEQIDLDFSNVYDTKLAGDVLPAGTLAGKLTKEMAQYLGLHEDVHVAVSIIDAHAAVVGAGLCKKNEMLIVIGTSSCHLLLSDVEKIIPGVSGVVKDGIFEGLYAYEAGQVAVGDIFSYFMSEQLPAKYEDQAEKRGISTFDLLNELASQLSPGKNGLLALDWHNGNRSPYVNPNLSAVLIGETLSTKAFEKYRALIESTAYGTKMIVELFESSGIPVERILVTGGIPRKNQFLVQLYADILQKPIIVLEETQIPALGAAILGAAAFEKKPLDEVASHYGTSKQTDYEPNVRNEEVYQNLYENYKSMTNLFHQHSVMEQLYELRAGEEE